MGFPCGTMQRDSVLNASPIKEKKSPNTLRHESAHMLHLASNVLKHVLLMYFHDDTMRRDSISLPHQEFLMNFLFFLFFKIDYNMTNVTLKRKHGV
jgi:hypothetical protein